MRVAKMNYHIQTATSKSYRCVTDLDTGNATCSAMCDATTSCPGDPTAKCDAVLTTCTVDTDCYAEQTCSGGNCLYM